MSDELRMALWIVPGVIGFVVVFVLMWIFVVWLIGTLGGWGRLAQRYRATHSTAPGGIESVGGRKWQGQYGFVNGARYGNALNLTTSERGLLLETVTLFRINHPPLFIPWHDLHSPRHVTFRHRELVELQVGHPTFATIRLPRTFVEQSNGAKFSKELATQSPA